jgi:hypothetical protein
MFKAEELDQLKFWFHHQNSCGVGSVSTELKRSTELTPKSEVLPAQSTQQNNGTGYLILDRIILDRIILNPKVYPYPDGLKIARCVW